MLCDCRVICLNKKNILRGFKVKKKKLLYCSKLNED